MSRWARWPFLVALVLALVVGAAAPGASDDTSPGTEPTGFEAHDELLRRHAIPDQRLVVWLPARFEASGRAGGVAEFTEPSQGTAVRFSRNDLTPGLGLDHLVDLTNKRLTAEGTVQHIIRAHRLKVAGQPAVEILADTTIDGVAHSSHIVTSIDPSGESYRLIVLHCEAAAEDECDLLLRSVLRGFTPLDRVCWDEGFEHVRTRVDTVAGPLPHARSLETMAAVADPAAAGQPWVAQQVAALGRTAPVLLLDGLLHHHPRVRETCLEGLVPLISSPELRDAVLARALRDPDPAVRYRAALRAAGDSSRAGAVLSAVLSADDKTARSGAFQLLAVLDPQSRRELLTSLLTERDQLPPTSQRLLVLTLGEWGGEGATALLARIWTRTLDRRLRSAAREELLRRGDPKALAAARKRLLDEGEEPGLDAATAARYLAVHARLDSSADEWEQLSEQLVGKATSGGERSDDADHLAASSTLRELADYLRSIPESASPDEERTALRRLLLKKHTEAWALERYGRLAATLEPTSRPQPWLEAAAPLPGALLLSYGGLLERLELPSAGPNQLFHTMRSALAERMEQWAADPILSRADMARATGIDFQEPWRWRGWLPQGPAGLRFARESGLGMAFSWSLGCGDPDQLLRLLLRGSCGDAAPADLVAVSALVSTSLPLLPVGLVAIWEDQHKHKAGEDEEVEPGPTEVYPALVPEVLADGSTRYALHRLGLDDTRPATREALFIRVSGHRLTLAQDPELLAPELPREAATGEQGTDTHLELDLAAVLREHLAGSTAGSMLDGLRIEADTHTDGTRIATTFELAGLPAGWLAVARPAAPGRLRAPASILPADALTWVVVSFDAASLAERLRETANGHETDPELHRFADLVAASGGEAGVAVVGLPDDSVDSENAWEQQLVGFIEVSTKAAGRFLDGIMPESRHVDGVRVSGDGQLAATYCEGFLVCASNPEILRQLRSGPRLATSPVFGRITPRMPPEAAVHAGGDVDALADAILAELTEDPDRGIVTLAAEFFRAFGPIAAWVTVDGERVRGTVALEPRLMGEEARERVRRLVGFPGYTSGSVPVDGFPTDLDADRLDLLEVTLELADPAWTFPEQWASRRVEVQAVAPARYRLVSRPATALPETSLVELPIADAASAPYLRTEGGIQFHTAEVESLASEIRGSETDPARIVRKVIAWCTSQLSYKIVRDADDVRDTLASRQADCSEFAQLTVALCRALGIPARTVHGLVVAEDAAILHAWVEVYLDRWYEVDPTSGRTEVPATSVPVPDGNGLLLASTPGNRLVVESTRLAAGSRGD